MNDISNKLNEELKIDIWDNLWDECIIKSNFGVWNSINTNVWLIVDANLNLSNIV